MNKEAYSVYLEGFEKGYWDIKEVSIIDTNLGAYFKKRSSEEWKERVYAAENGSLSAVGTYVSAEFKAAERFWEMVKNSPLNKALK